MSQELTMIQTFKMQIESESSRTSFLKFMKPELLDKFTAIIYRAVQENQDLLTADRTSLLLACQRAAQDNLMPDGREGALILYGKLVQWQPMISGIKKKMSIAGFDVRAEIVYKNDEFLYEMGDDPKIIHRPAVFGSRGDIIGAYAIGINQETGEKYRETMDIEELNKVHNASRGKNSTAWTIWKTEMFRKAVIKRLKKYMPVFDQSILDMIDRDNEEYDFKPQPSQTARDVQAAVRAAPDEPMTGVLMDREEPEPKKATKKKVVKKVDPQVEAAAKLLKEAEDEAVEQGIVGGYGQEPPPADEAGNPLDF